MIRKTFFSKSYYSEPNEIDQKKMIFRSHLQQLFLPEAKYLTFHSAGERESVIFGGRRRARDIVRRKFHRNHRRSFDSSRPLEFRQPIPPRILRILFAAAQVRASSLRLISPLERNEARISGD